MSKHTPGPWDYGWEIQPNGCPTVGHKGLMVCMVAHSAKDPEQKETALANANLIAASPDLYASAWEALGVLVGIRDGAMSRNNRESMVDEAIASIEKSIAKARGES